MAWQCQTKADIVPCHDKREKSPSTTLLNPRERKSPRIVISAIFGQRIVADVNASHTTYSSKPLRLEHSRNSASRHCTPPSCCVCVHDVQDLVYVYLFILKDQHLPPLILTLPGARTHPPDDLSSSQRRVLEAALRVDQAGEVAANYIYAGQFVVLRRDPAAAALIQVCIYAQSFPFVTT